MTCLNLPAGKPSAPPHQIVHDPKNMTAKSSEDLTNPDEEYETQYLSQVSRSKDIGGGFFDVGNAAKVRRQTTSANLGGSTTVVHHRQSRNTRKRGQHLSKNFNDHENSSNMANGNNPSATANVEGALQDMMLLDSESVV